MIPVALHADGTDCHHAGSVHATADGPRCPGGLLVTHFRYNGQLLTMDEMTAIVARMAQAFTGALEPMVAAFAEMGRIVCESPGLRALAALYEGDAL